MPKFNISENPAKIYNLSIRVQASALLGTSGTLIKLYAWNHISSSYISVNQSAPCTKCNLTAQLTPASSFVNSSGDLYLAVQGETPPANNKIYYAEINVTYSS